MRYASLEEWVNEEDGYNLDQNLQMQQGQQEPQMGSEELENPEEGSNADEEPEMAQGPEDISQGPEDISQDPEAPDMPSEEDEQDFEQWKNNFFKESLKGDVNRLIEMIHQVRDLELDSYPRKFVEDNLQVCFLRQNANIDKASKEIRKLIKEDLDRNNPSVSVVNHIDIVLNRMPELNKILIKLKGLLGMKSDLHRKFTASLIGAVQVGNGGNNEDIIYNDKEFSIKMSTRYNDKWGKIDLGKWCLKEDDASKFLTEPELEKLEEGSPEEKDVLRKRIVIESIAESYNKKGFIINVVGENGTIYTLGWDISGSIKDAYTNGKIVVKNIQNENSEAMINDDGKIVSLVDIKILYCKETGEVDEEGKPVKEELELIERIDGNLFLTGSLNTIKEVSSGFLGMTMKEIPYAGNPSDLHVLMRCVPSSTELIMRQC